jgi:Tol biopolymer transport system component
LGSFGLVTGWAISLTPDFYEISPYLYTFHIFSLDLNRGRLIEKFLLSQWQGKINSLTWWDKNTIEFVGTQGLSLKPERYRYSVSEQELTEIETPRSSGRPLLSQVQDQRTALVLQEKQEVRIELIDEQQKTHRSWQLEDSNVELGWVPDGSGVLVHLPLVQQLYLLYWDGERRDLDIKRPAYQTLLNPAYRPDGKALYYVLENRRQEVEWWQDTASFKSLYANTDLVAFSPDGTSLVYAVEQGEEWHLWLQSSSGDLRQLTKDPLPRKPSHLSWSEDGRWLVYKIARQIWFYSIEEGISKELGFESAFIEPLSYLPDEQILLVVKTNGETRNVWSLNISTMEQKQLTFGAVGTVAAIGGKFYFQYRAKSGLWAMDFKDTKPQALAKNLAANSRLLKVDDEGVYFVAGGYCRESAIQYLQLADGNIKDFWTRKQSAVITRDFHPQAGLLQTPCRLPASHILMAQ